MDAVKAPATPTHSLRQWRRKSAPEEDDENGLGMCLPLGLKQDKPPLRPKQIPLTDEEVRELEEDRTLDKGYKVWRSLPMESDLDKKLKAGQLTNRTADFTKEARPEAYLPGFSSRAGGPISRPHKSPPRARPRAAPKPAAPVVPQHTSGANTINATNAHIPQGSATHRAGGLQTEGSAISARREASDMSTASSVDNRPVLRGPDSGVLRDSVLRQKSGS